MDLAMTVGAAPVEEKVRVLPIPISVRTIVTLRTKPRHAYFEQPLVNGTVGIMAVSTIIEDRRMLKEKRSSSLRMTGVTVFVHAVLYEL
jgi:hypothetical protein